MTVFSLTTMRTFVPVELAPYTGILASCDTTPAIRRHINVFVEGKRARLNTRLEPGADVFILTAISGG
jgi:hypothetical protein